MKTCTDCKRALPDESFSRDKHTRDGLRVYCRVCTGNRARAGYGKHAPAYAARHRKRTYGLDEAQFTAMLAAQGNVCAICSAAFSGPMDRHIDHNHTTGAVRAVLCSACNTGLAVFEKRPGIAALFEAYLRQHS